MSHSYILASLKNQILAKMFDLLLLFILTGLVFFLLWKINFYSQYIWIFTNLFALLFTFCLFVLPLTFASGQTLGYRLFNIQIIFNQPISLAKKMLFFCFREFFLIFVPVLLIWIFFYLYLLIVSVFNLTELNSQSFFARVSFFYFFWWVIIFIFTRINPSQQLFYDRWYDVLTMDKKAKLIKFSSSQKKPSSPAFLNSSPKIKGCFIELNTEQREAVVLPITQNVLILAGPGTGKTSVLIEKIIYLLERNEISLDRVLTLTFSRQACRSIKAKIAKVKNTEQFSHPSLFTYHGFCYFFLNIEVFKNIKINILDQQDQKQVIHKLLKISLSVSHLKQEPDKEMVKEILRTINALQNSLIFDYNQFLNFKTKNSLIFDWNNQYDQFIWDFYQDYLLYKKQEKFYDFVDLLSQTYLFLKDHPLILKKWRKKYDYVFADEFQDTNFLQYKILSLLTDKGRAIPISVVGDPDQTIYAWRGADINLILNFVKDFHQVQTIKLLNNYRSQTKIVHLANKLIKYNKQRIKKKIVATKKTGDNIVFYFNASKFAQAQFLVDKIEFLQKRKVKLGEIVILYRVNYLAGVLESLLLKANIAYVVIKGQEFFKRKEIKDMLVLLSVINDPKNIFLENILTWIPYVGLQTVAKINLLAQKNHKSLFEYILLATDELFLIKNGDKIHELVNNLNNLNTQLTTIKSLSILLNLLFQNCYQQFLETKIDYQTRLKNITVLINEIASNFSNDHSHLSLLEQMQEFLVQTQISVLNELDTSMQRVKLMTVHNAKGLEFKYVLLFHISGDNFPNMNREIINIEEERRLFFVALTRAKENIFLTTHPRNRSIFIIETASAKEVTTINDR